MLVFVCPNTRSEWGGTYTAATKVKTVKDLQILPSLYTNLRTFTLALAMLAMVLPGPGAQAASTS